MKHALVAILFVLSIAAPAIAQDGQAKVAQSGHALPTLKSGEMPLYPPLPRMAHIQGTVKLRVSTDGERVTTVTVVEGQPMLAKAAEENVKTWQFVTHSPTTFETTFAFRLVAQSGCEPLSDNGKTTLTLPTEIDVVAPERTIGGCDPDAELDLSEPLRVFLTACEVDGTAVPCDKFIVQLTNNSVVVTPKRFKANGSEGFFVPPSFRKLDYFGVLIQTPKGAFSLPHIDKSFLKGKWRVVIDHAPFQEEWQYLTEKNQRCLGLVHFQWSEPERLASTPCN